MSEDTKYERDLRPLLFCLNPYSNGICPKTLDESRVGALLEESLNPYSNGICPKTQREIQWKKDLHSLNPYSNGICPKTSRWLGS